VPGHGYESDYEAIAGSHADAIAIRAGRARRIKTVRPFGAVGGWLISVTG
jgi:hypothetical protein